LTGGRLLRRKMNPCSANLRIEPSQHQILSVTRRDVKSWTPRAELKRCGERKRKRGKPFAVTAFCIRCVVSGGTLSILGVVRYDRQRDQESGRSKISGDIGLATIARGNPLQITLVVCGVKGKQSFYQFEEEII
jgi:hypothetical protein